MTIKQELTQQVKNVLESLGIADVEPNIAYPSDPKHGDYSSNVALVAAKKLKRSPMELAEEIASKFRIQSAEFRIEVVKPGFINFWISEKRLITSIEKQELPNVEQGKPIIVEYSSPNIAKPFTIGHLRSTIIGDAIANLLYATGWHVRRDNHVGDWGTQFGKQIYALIHLGEGSLEKNLEKIEHSKRPVQALVSLYVEFHDKAEKDPTLEDKARVWFKKLEARDSEARRLWQKCIDWSWKEFAQIYELLGIMFTENDGHGYGESFFEDKMAAVITELTEERILKPGKEGAQMVFFPDELKLPPLMILKKDGATLYSTRDLATDKFRRDQYGEDVVIINEVGAEQALYFRQLYALEEMLGWFKKGQRIHIKHGLYRFKDQKMSTRKGNVVWLEDVLEEATKRAYDLQKHTTEFESEDQVLTTSHKYSNAARKNVLKGGQRLNIAKDVGMGAIKWNDLKRSSEQDIIFDWEDMLNMQGNSGPYIQYTFVRTQSILSKSQSSHTSHKVAENGQLQVEERELLRLLARFPEVVEEAAMRFAPQILCTYLFDLAQTFNLFYQKCPILKAQADQKQVRLLLTASTGKVLQRGLSLLGIAAPEKM